MALYKLESQLLLKTKYLFAVEIFRGIIQETALQAKFNFASRILQTEKCIYKSYLEAMFATLLRNMTSKVLSARNLDRYNFLFTSGRINYNATRQAANINFFTASV